MKVWFASVFAAAALAAPAAAHDGPEPPRLPTGTPVTAWPGANYDPSVPTLRNVVGHDFGEEITNAADLRRYFEALAAAAPDRVRLVEYGRSWQGRPLYYAVIGAPQSIARLDAIKAGMQALADPRSTAPAEAERLISTLPTVVWLAYAVHGDEIGPADAAALTAYHLLAARGDARVPAMLSDALIVINPLQNPDGRERFIASTTSARGLQADGDPLSAERDQPWPGGRFNHYVFDLNRDWFAQTQPETQGHVQALLDWYPQVLADVHEMGTDATYFFPPTAAPTNPFQTEAQMRMRERIGRTIGGWFDRFGLDYFTREVFDLFYPGYGDGWPSYHGATAMTYEQGSSRGLVARRRDGTTLTYAETVESQLAASLATIETAAANRERLLREFWQYRQSAITENRNHPARTIVIPAQADANGAATLADLLARQGVDVLRAPGPVQVCGRRVEAGSYVIDSAQPAGRLVRVLMDQKVALEAGFAERQERRRAAGLPDEFYDVTAWSLPLLFNLDVLTCRGAPPSGLVTVEPGSVAGAVENPDAAFGYVVPWGETSAVRFLAAALRQGLRVKSADTAFVHAGRRYPAGSLVIERADNPDGLSATVRKLAAESGARVVGVADGWVSDGPNFGSSQTLHMPAPRIAMAWDDPTDRTAAGAARWVIERRFGYPVSAIRAERLTSADLSAFDVLILPQGGYGRLLGEAPEIKAWVRRGGVIIGLGSATRFLASPDANLLSVRREDAFQGEEKKAPDAKAATRPGTRLATEAEQRAAMQPARSAPDGASGVLARAVTNADHWMSAGVAANLHVLYQGGDIYTPVTLDEGTAVASFAGPNDVLASGYLWEETRLQLAHKPFAIVEPEGRGYVIGFTADPTSRGFMHGLDVILANAIFRGAAHADPVRR